MRMYWPDHKVSLEIVRSLHEEPFAGTDECWTVIRVTERQMEDEACFKRVMRDIWQRVSPQVLVSDEELLPSEEGCGLGPAAV